MLDLECRSSKKMAAPEISSSPSGTSPSHLLPLPTSPRVRDASAAAAAYEHYFRLPQLSELNGSRDFPAWRPEPILKPSLQSLEITFRFISLALSDPRPYSNHREWKRRLESLAMHQIELIAALCEDEDAAAGAPIAELSTDSSSGLLTRERSSQEVWKLPGATPVVSRTSETSLLPRLAAWERTEDVASKILFQIECQMHRCPFTLGLGEPNLAGKPNLEYDLVVRPTHLHSLRRRSSSSSSSSSSSWKGGVPSNEENDALFTIHQILESWLFASRMLLKRIGERLDGKGWDEAARDCWILERIWKLLLEVEHLHLLMDPDDFLRLKSQLALRAKPGSEALCFRSRALLDVTRLSKDLKRMVPSILGVEVDPNGGPRVQDAAMELFRGKGRAGGDAARIHLLQAFQAIEGAMKGFFFGYRQLVVAVMGSLEASSGAGLWTSPEASDSLTQMFLEAPYFPSLDAAKAFLGDFWQHTRLARSTSLV